MTVYRSSAAFGGDPYRDGNNNNGRRDAGGRRADGRRDGRNDGHGDRHSEGHSRTYGRRRHAAAAPTIGSVIRTIIRGAGQTLITFGLVVLLFAAYEVYGKALQVNGEQDVLNNQLNNQWKGPAASAPLSGKAMARLVIPRLDKKWAVVEGVTPKDIKLSPGHYPKSQLPGQLGNFAVAGHRIAAIFYDLDQLKNGDVLAVQTRTDWFIYKVSKTEIVDPHEVSVVDPVPHKPGATPTERLITLTTCNPKWDNYERLIIHGTLARTQPVSQGDPAEIAGA